MLHSESSSYYVNVALHNISFQKYLFPTQKKYALKGVFPSITPKEYFYIFF